MEGATFGAMMLMHEYTSSGAFVVRGAVIDVVDALASSGLNAMSKALKTKPQLYSAASARIVERCLNFHRRYLPSEFIAENTHEWQRHCELCEARFAESRSRIPYPFGKFNALAEEWLDESLEVGNLASLRADQSIQDGL